MKSANDSDEQAAVSPDEAFSLLANETRIRILETLGKSDAPLTYTELRERVGIDPGMEFNYHLETLLGHFVRKMPEGYTLQEAGTRIVKAVLAGGVNTSPDVDRVRIDQECQLCEAPIEVGYSSECVETYCTECAGIRSRDDSKSGGHLGARYLPPPGVQNRTPDQMFRVAWIWTMLKIFALACSVCPNCSALVRKRVDVCKEHDDGTGICDECDTRYAIRVNFRCRNCILEESGTAAVALASHDELLKLLTANGRNPIAPDSVRPVQQVYSDYEEEVLSIDPLVARFTFEVEGETLTVTVNDELEVTATSR